MLMGPELRQPDYPGIRNHISRNNIIDKGFHFGVLPPHVISDCEQALSRRRMGHNILR